MGCGEERREKREERRGWEIDTPSYKDHFRHDEERWEKKKQKDLLITFYAFSRSAERN
jgi:hypothetical protein